MMMNANSSQFSGDLTDLQSRLGQKREEKEKLEAKIKEMQENLSNRMKEAETAGSSLALQLQKQLDAETNEKKTN